MGLKLIRAVTLGRKRGLEGGRARADKMSTAERAEIARKPPPMSRCRRSPPSTSSKAGSEPIAAAYTELAVAAS
jgi:hypothetical protein